MRRSVSCDVQQYSKYGYITHCRLFCLHAKYYHTQLGHTIVMNIWNVDAQQMLSYLTWAEPCYIMSVSNKLSYLLVSVMLLSQDRVTIRFTVKFEIKNIAFTIKDNFEGQCKLKHGLNYTVRLYNEYMYMLSCMFWMAVLSCKESCSIQPSKMSSCYDIWLTRYRITNLMLTL